MQKLAITLAAAALLSPAALAQFTLVAPNGYNALEGNSNNAFPWNRGASSIQVQCIYDSTNFTLQGVTSPILISQVKFRADATTSSWTGGTYGQLQVDVSTCPVDFAAASSTFASNHGADRTTVQNGPFTILGGTGNGAGVPGPYHVVVPFSAPFVYDPTTGNDLCIDIMVDGSTWGGGTLVQCDNVSGATAVPPPLGTRVYNTSGFNLPTGTVGTHYTAVCEFTYVPAAGLWPSFSATPTTGASPLTVQFTDQTYTDDPAGVLAWQWDFDGDSVIDSTLQNPSFIYTGCGSYNVSLTAIDASHPPGTLTRNNYITTDNLVASFTSTAMGNGVFQFNDTSVPTPQTWAWDFNGDSVIDSTIQNPTWAYPPNCTNNVITLTATLSCRTATATSNIFVAPAALTAVPFTGGNGTSSATVVGNMFDISVTATDGISICALTQGIYSYVGPFQADVYITQDSYLGKDANAAAWRLVASGTGVSAGGGTTTPSQNDVVLNNSFYLPAGNYGVVVFLSALPSGTMNVCYTNGPQGPFSNADLVINPNPTTAGGISKYNLFGTGSFSPRCWNGTFHYTKVSLTGAGGYGFFGEGCPGTSGVTNLTANAAPRLGQPLAVTANNLPLNAAIALLGFSNTTSVFGPLPLDLSIVGAPGCFGRVSNDAQAVVIGASNSATWSLPIPNLPGLLGLQAYQQMLVLDSAANGLGAVASDAAGFVIGQ